MSENRKKLISIVIPAYNEEPNIDELAKRLQGVMDKMTDYDFEVIVVENGSTDSTFQKLLAVREKDRRFRILQLLRNFDCDGGITAGLHFASGDAAIVMTADLQDPPEMIPKFIAKWEEGYENVYGVVTKRKDFSLFRRVCTKIFYWLINRMSKGLLPQNASDFRLVDRKVYRAVNSMEERSRFMRGMFMWVGGKSIGIPHERPERYAGKTTGNFFALLNFALRGIFIFSYLPLRLITYLGIIISGCSFIFLIYTIITAFTQGVPFAGYGTLVSIMAFMFGMLFLALGIISEYIALIFDETKQRPNFIVKSRIGFDNEENQSGA
jgi:dolichol-phosphate mannosyltransferase